MAQAETHSTTAALPQRKIAFWNQLATPTQSPRISDPATVAKFARQQIHTSSSLVRIAEVHSDPQLVRHTRAQVYQTRVKTHFLHLQLDGESLTRQDRREARLMPGDITICDNSRPYEITCEKANRVLVFGFPDELMRRHIQYPQSVCAVLVPGNNGIGGVLSDLLKNVWHRCLQDKDFDVNSAVTDAILGLVANAYRLTAGATIDHNSMGAAHRVRIVNFIEDKLGDSLLTPTRIAAAFRITTRYLHHLFSEEDETVGRYILRRRLEECARALSSTSQRRRTITAIAFDHGFSSATHFGRVFRSRYGMTPREYRKRSNVTG
jgi:AraC-like DNA-binding protein